ncbi:MAG: cupin domain-containing protein [Candidatus Korobacteraceae bacterium]
MRRASLTFLAMAFCAALLLNGQQRSEPPLYYPATPRKPAPYTPPHKPHTRLADIKAKHKGKAEWSEWVVRDEHLWSQYIQSQPGSKVSPRFHPDTREWWVILEGEIRFNIEGQEPFVARRRSMVQVPPQTIYSMETVGNQPALRFQTNIAHATLFYPEPPKTSSKDAPQPVRLNRKPFPYGSTNKPHINLDDMVANDPDARPGRFVHDDRAMSNINYGWGSKLPPLDEKDNGHFHPEGNEYWVILMGQMRYKMEGVGVFIASEGDVVYAPKNTFHAPRWWGDGPSCRVSMNGFVGNATGLEVTD